ncbi:MAG: hypothetical protein AAGJ08_08385 [Cyanobacteria bacterium P01_H01_bin.35]
MNNNSSKIPDRVPYLGLAEKVLWVRVGVISQESGVRRNGEWGI